jgi:glycosyltransferase involved in cell wall biosynthesis
MPWGYMAARRAIGLAQQQHFDVLLTSCPSYSSHVAGLLVKKRIGIPWVADFRDLWVDRPYRHVLSHWHRYVDKRLERAVIRGADQIILASPPWKVRFRETYGESLELKMTVITNGFDREETESKSTKASMDNEVVFVYTGAMYGSESPAPFLEVLARLKSYAPHLIDPVRVRLIGYAEDELASLLDIIHRAALQEHVAFLPPQPHSRCLMEQMSADVLLLFSGPQHQETIRGKSFEYMATGKPILALIPEHGVQAELLRKAGTAFIVQHGDVTATERVVRDLITQPQLRSVRPNWDFINSFDRRALTAQLAEVLDTCAKRIRLNSKPYERQDTAPRIWP